MTAPDAAEGARPPATRSLRFNSTFTAASGMVGYGLSIVTGPVLARALGPAGRGDLAAVLVPAQIFGWLLAFGIPLAAIYHAPEHRNREIVMAAWAWAAAVGGVVVLGAWWLVPGYLSGHGSVTVPWLRAFLVVMIAFVPSMTAMNLLMARGRVVAFNATRQFPLVANAVLVVGLFLAGRLTLTTALGAALLSNVVWFVVALSYTRSWPGTGFRRAVLRLQVRYGSRVAFGSAAYLVVARLDQFLLVGIVTSRQLGLYAVSVTAAGLSTPIGQGIAQVLMPHLRNARYRGATDGHQTTARALRWTLLASSSCALVVAVSAPWVLPFVLGSGFAGSVTPLWILLPGQIANDLATVVSAELQAHGRPGVVSQGIGVAAVVTVAGLWFAVGRFGIVGAAMVTTLSQWSYLAFVANASRRRDGDFGTDGSDIVTDRSAPGGAAEEEEVPWEHA